MAVHKLRISNRGGLVSQFSHSVEYGSIEWWIESRFQRRFYTDKFIWTNLLETIIVVPLYKDSSRDVPVSTVV